MRSIVFILLLIFVISCKKTISQEKENTKVTNIDSVSKNQNLLTLFIKTTSFDFNGTNKEKISTLLDNFDNKKALIKIFTEEEGTGTLGWIEIDFDNAVVYDITLDPDKPQKLTYKAKLYLELKESLFQKDNCLKQNIYPKLPYKQKIDSKKVIYDNLKCNIKGASDWFCGHENLRYLPLFKNEDVSGILIPMDCGDSPYRYYLLTINNGTIISSLYVEGVLSEPETIKDLETTSFEIDENYVIIIKTENVNSDIGKVEIRKYKITEEGKIVEMN